MAVSIAAGFTQLDVSAFSSPGPGIASGKNPKSLPIADKVG